MNDIKNIQEKGQKLYELRRLIDEKTEEIGKLKETKELLSDDLLSAFKKVGIDQIKVNGSSFSRAVKKGVEVTNEVQAFKWAYENRYVSINKTLCKQGLDPILKSGKELPAGFEAKEVEYISVRKPKSEGEVAVNN